MRLLAIQGLVAEAAEQGDYDDGNGGLPDFAALDLPDFDFLGRDDPDSPGASVGEEVPYSSESNEDSSDDEDDDYGIKVENVMATLKSAKTIEDLLEMLQGREADDIFEVLEYDDMESLINGLKNGTADPDVVGKLTQGIDEKNGVGLGQKLQKILDDAIAAAQKRKQGMPGCLCHHPLLLQRFLN